MPAEEQDISRSILIFVANDSLRVRCLK